MILDKALQREVRVAAKGTMANPQTLASLTCKDLAICDRFAVAIKPPAVAKKNMV